MTVSPGGTLTVFKFHNAYGAENALTFIQTLQSKQLIELQDAAIVSWPQESSKPKTRQLTSASGIGALDGAFWGLLFGLLFFVPFFGAAIGAVTGAITASFVDIGIDDKFIKSVKEKVVPGTSALFLLTRNAVLDKISDEFKKSDIHMELISSNLDKSQESKLRTIFGI